MINKTPPILITILIALLVFLFSPWEGEVAPEPEMVSAVPIGGAFALIDENGARVTEQNYAGTYKLVFFGFTFCPSVCPTELLKIGDVLNMLADDPEKITPLFITTDPARDTPEILKTYTDKFDPRIVGLTGTQDQVDAAMKSFRAYGARVGEGPDYMMDHSAFIYLTDEKNHMVTIYHADQNARAIAADLKRRL